MEQSIDITKRTRFVINGSRSWWEEKNHNGHLSKTIIPNIRFTLGGYFPEVPDIGMLNIEDHPESKGRMIAAALEHEAKQHYLLPDVMADLDNFLNDHLPWTNSWEVPDDCDFLIEEMFNNGDRDAIRPLLIAFMSTRGFAKELGNNHAIFDPGLTITNLDYAHDVISADDLREGIRIATGTYSRKLAGAFRNHYSDSDDLLESMTVMKYTRGLPPEYIEEMIHNGFLQKVPEHISYRGIPVNDDGSPSIPEWVSSQPHHRRAAWTMNLGVFTECITLSQDIDMSEIDLRTSDIRQVHESIIMQQVQENKEDIDTDAGRQIGSEKIFRVVENPDELIRIGHDLSVCVGGVSYRERLTSGVSSFVEVQHNGVATAVAELDMSTDNLVEASGFQNNRPEPEDYSMILSGMKEIFAH